jgi:type II secretory pathway pseudopilin PulG
MRNKGEGFSIAELLGVMALVSIAAAASLPVGVSHLRQHQTSQAAQAVASEIQSARIHAVQENSVHGMLLSFGNPGPSELHLAPRNRPGVRDRLEEIDRAGLPPAGVDFKLPEGFRFEPAGGSFNGLIFRSDGTVEGTVVEEAVEGVVAVEGMNFVVKVKHSASGLTQSILVGRTGTVVVR